VSLAGQLQRLEELLAERFPDLLAAMQPGLDDAGVERMRAAVAPLTLGPELEKLYRWRNGGQPGLFAGWRLLPVDEVIANRQGQLGEPPAWFRLFGDRVVAFVTLGVGGESPNRSLWYGHTHDLPLDRIADSLEGFVAACADALGGGALGRQRDSLLLEGGRDASSDSFTPFRLVHSPTASTFRAVEAHDRVVRTPELDWPAPWLVSLGLDAARIAPRGRTHTVAQLDGSPYGTVATLLGTVAVHGFAGNVLQVVFSDDTAELRLDVDTAVTVFSPHSDGRLNEIDISLGTDLEAASGVAVLAVRPLPRS